MRRSSGAARVLACHSAERRREAGVAGQEAQREAEIALRAREVVPEALVEMGSLDQQAREGFGARGGGGSRGGGRAREERVALGVVAQAAEREARSGEIAQLGAPARLQQARLGRLRRGRGDGPDARDRRGAVAGDLDQGAREVDGDGRHGARSGHATRAARHRARSGHATRAAHGA